ncbi:MAG: sigma 54-interacting transcriptional regulator, partial [Holophagales bacterium]|nr:sigma 54-interacting transcriptional regulator [Holophagales bacterium]
MTDRSQSGFSQATTRTDSAEIRAAAARAIPVLTLLSHPDPDRVGERAALPSLLSGAAQPISRLEPAFALPGGGLGRPLAYPQLSRKPVVLRADRATGLVIDRTGSPTRLAIDGEALEARTAVSAEILDRGVVLSLGRRVTLLFHFVVPSPRRPPDFGLIGESDVVLEVRRQIERLANRERTVLLRGETGTGKELVARALHQAGPRRDAPYRAVNLGAVPAELAAAELFGATRGAYTGAGAGRRGYFRQAHGGTLFLDEVAAAPPE